MNGALLLILGAAVLGLAYRFYGRFLSRLFGVDTNRTTPAHTCHDGVDYLPTRPSVLFGHHFASIAGAGPIVGPVLAAYMGWGAVALWILIGCVFIGAMHDFSALFLSVRDNGRSIGHVIERELGFVGRQLFLAFCWAALVLVVAMFGRIVAVTFTGKPAVATASLYFMVLAPLFGWLTHRRGVSLSLASLVFVPLLFLGVWIGQWLPLNLQMLLGLSAERTQTAWLIVLMVYVFIASIIPVWMLLQPRDYLNAYLLYAMIILGIIGIAVVRPEFRLPAFSGFALTKPDDSTVTLFPMLFVTVACGACSGFHALVASGTTAKQLDSEKHMLPIGYGSMLVEGLLGLMALTSVAILSTGDYWAALKELGPVGAFASGLAGFTERIGLPIELGLTFMSLAISAFLLTTLDTATRLARFTWQELFLPPAASSKAPPPVIRLVACSVCATTVTVAAAMGLALTGSLDQIWPVFGATNQLLAALTLLVITLYLTRRKTKPLVALLPTAFMMAVSGWALLQLFRQNLGSAGNRVLLVATALLLLLSMALATMAVISVFRVRRGEKVYG